MATTSPLSLKTLLFAAASAPALLLAAPALAQVPQVDEAEDDNIVVTGRRISDAVSAIGVDSPSNTVAVTREELLSAPPGISGLKMLETLPGFNVQTDGALGLYEFGNSVTVRAFNLQQIGFTLDGIPMGRPDAFGGSPIFRYVDNENLGSVVASPGAGDVTMPSYTSLGPLVEYNTTELSADPAALFSLSLGDDEFNRSFVKLETGQIGPFAAYISRSKTDSNLWRGAGSIDREHVEAKARYTFTDDAYLQATFVYNDFYDFDSPSGSRATFEGGAEDINGNSGRDYGYIDFVPFGCNTGLDAPVDFNNDGTIDGDDFQPVSVGGTCTDYYIDRVNIREDALGSLNLNWDLSDAFNVDIVAYYEDKDGFGVSPDGYSNTLTNYLEQAAVGLDVTHPRGVQYGLSGVGGDRSGVVATFTYEIANHTFEFGGWLENDSYRRTQLRLNKTAGSPAGEVIRDEVAYYRRDYKSTREARQFFVNDTIALMDGKLNLEIGFKGLSIDYELDGYRDFDDYSRVVDGTPVAGYGPQVVGDTFEDLFQPMVGAVYSLNDTDQIFASYAENFAIPRDTDSIYSTAISFDPPAPEGETSKNFEVGYRTNHPSFNLAAALFYSTFDNRIGSGSVINPATEQPETFSVNLGETESYGAEVSGVYQPDYFNDQLYANFNLTYNHATLVDGFGVNEAGNLLADSPEWIFTGGVTWEPTEWALANISTKYTGERYADFAEAEFQDGNLMEDYFLWSGYVDLGGPNDFGVPENVSVRLNVDNLFDEETLPFTFTTTGTGAAFYRPLNPRTVQLTVTARF